MSVHPSSAAPTSMPRPAAASLARGGIRAGTGKLSRVKSPMTATSFAPRRSRAALPRKPASISRTCAAPDPKGASPRRTSTIFCASSKQFKFRRLVQPHEGAPGSREELSKMRQNHRASDGTVPSARFRTSTPPSKSTWKRWCALRSRSRPPKVFGRRHQLQRHHREGGRDDTRALSAHERELRR